MARKNRHRKSKKSKAARKKGKGARGPGTKPWSGRTGPAVWNNMGQDQNVHITGRAGEVGGRQYANIKGSMTGIPLDEVTFGAPSGAGRVDHIGRRPRAPMNIILPSSGRVMGALPDPFTDMYALTKAASMTTEVTGMDFGRVRPFFTAENFTGPGKTPLEKASRLAKHGAATLSDNSHRLVNKGADAVAKRPLIRGIAQSVAKRPGLVGALGIAALAIGVGGKMAVGGANDSMEMNRMHVTHGNMQRQAAKATVPVGGLGRQTTPTFSGRRVSGGHMGATGDLVFGMNRRR